MAKTTVVVPRIDDPDEVFFQETSGIESTAIPSPSVGRFPHDAASFQSCGRRPSELTGSERFQSFLVVRIRHVAQEAIHLDAT